MSRRRVSLRRLLPHDVEAFEIRSLTQPVAEGLVEAAALRAAEAARRFPPELSPEDNVALPNSLAWLRSLKVQDPEDIF